jgi:cytochrome c-type biogenesis protein CcmH/NrfG
VQKRITKAVTADEGFSEAWMVLAEVLVDQNNIDEAIKVYQTV